MTKDLFIFIDESGLTDIKSKQKYLVVAFAVMKNKDFALELISEIKIICNKKGKPIKSKEIKFHELEPLQKEVAIQIINSRYTNFYVCFLDLEKSSITMVSGKYEQNIQTKMIHNVLSKLDKNELREYERIMIIMDKKLSKQSQDSIKEEFQKHVGTKKGIYLQTMNSSKVYGIQVADIIAGAFRAKLMKKSDLFHIDLTQIFQIPTGNDINNIA